MTGVLITQMDVSYAVQLFYGARGTTIEYDSSHELLNK